MQGLLRDQGRKRYGRESDNWLLARLIIQPGRVRSDEEETRKLGGEFPDGNNLFV